MSDDKPSMSNDKPLTRTPKNEVWGALGLAVGGIVTGLAFSHGLGREFGPLGFGIGAGIAAALGFVAGAKFHGETVPLYRAGGFLVAFPGVAALLTLKVESDSSWLIIGLVTSGWVLMVLATHFALRRYRRKAEHSINRRA